MSLIPPQLSCFIPFCSNSILHTVGGTKNCTTKKQPVKSSRMVEPASSLAVKVAEFLISPIKDQLQYVFCYNTYIQGLREEVEDLNYKRTGMELLVDAAKRNAEIVGPDVLDWLKKVENVQEKANQVLEKTTNLVNGSFCCSRSLSLKSRYMLGKKAAKVNREVVKLKEEGRFSTVGYPAPPPQMPYPAKQDSGVFESRMLTRKEVIDALKDSESSIFGICGMAGVGKTTMVQEIASKVKVETLFDEVAVAVVSRDQDLIKIQDQIADALSLTIPEKSNIFVRAERLYARLMDEEKKLLLVLDDLWQELDFRTVGIPLLGERTGFKILLTSRQKGVCISMGAQIFFEVKVLPKQEAWSLFKEAAGISDDDDSEVVSIAEEVAEECGGLPLAIVVVGKALKNKREHAWNDALQQLRSSTVTNIRGMHNLVYSRIEWSYNYLESDEAKLLLLLSSLFPEDYNIPIESLVRYGKGLRLLSSVETVSATRNRVTSITDDLKSCYLMLPGKENCIKLHDVVRDVCLSIASKDEHVHKVRHSGLNEWPRSDTHKYYTAIALTFDTLDQIPRDLQYPQLNFLSLVCQSSALILPETFFEGMRELGVIVFSRTNIELSSSLQFLMSLQTLCLDHCTLNANLSIIGSLRGLEILSFYGSNLCEFPSEIRQLCQLRSLDLRFKKGPYPLPPGVLPSLQKLEELYLGAFFQAWWDEEGDRESSDIYVTEIRSLSSLDTFQICTHDSQLLLHILQELHLDRLKRFYIVKTSKRSIGDYQFRRSLHLIDIDEYLLLQPTVGLLLQRTDDLFLSVRDTKKFIDELDEDGCANLKRLTLSSCDYRYLVNSADQAPISAFANLESLILDGLRNLTEIFHGNVPDGSFGRIQEMKLEGLRSMRYLWTGLIKPPCFGNLKILEVSYCGSVRSLFSQYILKCLVQLRKIDVYECEMLETIISKEQEHNFDARNLEFPKLDYLKLQCLESFRSFDSQMIVENAPIEVRPIPFNRVDLSLQPLFNQVMLPSLEVLDIAHLNGLKQVISHQMQVGSLARLRVMIVQVCQNLQTVAISNSVRLLQKLELLEVYNCEELETVFDFKGLKAAGKDAGEILCRLESMELKSLAGLRWIWRNLQEGIQAFQRLKSLIVEDCHSLRFLLSPPMAEMLVSLENLRIEKCKMIKEIIGPYSASGSYIKEPSEELQSLQNQKIDNQKNEEERISIIVVFPRLRRLVLKDLENFRALCLDNYILNFPALTKFCIEGFPKMERLSSAEISAPMLRKIDLENGQSVPLKAFNSWLKGAFSDFSGAFISFSMMNFEGPFIPAFQ